MQNKKERKICWRLIRACNLDCPHCLAGHRNLFRDHTTAVQALRIVPTLKRLGISRVVITGGEPTLRDDLVEILEALTDQDITTHLTSHGVGLTTGLLQEMVGNLDLLRISIDGLESTHNRMRHQNTYQFAVDSVRRAIDCGLNIAINTVVMKQNLEDIVPLINKLAEAGVNRFVLLQFLERESGTQHPERIPSRASLRRLGRRILTLKRKRPELTIRFNHYRNREHRYVVLESDGTVVLCCENGEDVEYGNIVESPVVLRSALDDQELAHRQTITELADTG